MSERFPAAKFVISVAPSERTGEHLGVAGASSINPYEAPRASRADAYSPLAWKTTAAPFGVVGSTGSMLVFGIGVMQLPPAFVNPPPIEQLIVGLFST